MMKTLFSYGRILGLLAVVALATVSCEKSFVNDDFAPVQSKTAAVADFCGTETFDLTAGQHTVVGTVTVANDEENLYVTYTVAGMNINEVHLFVTMQPLAGRVAPGQAPYKAVVFAGSYTFTIPLAEIGVDCGATIYLQAHAALSNGETAYGGTITKPKKGSWFGTIEYAIICCEENEVEPTCQEETAFGGESAGDGNAWWFYFDPTKGETQKIFAGQHIVVGYVTYKDGVISIDLTGGWELQDVEEPLKIQGYNVIPSSRPAAGQFRTYKGSEIEVSVDEYPFYVVHLDVIRCE